jgi:hypothetical protein
LLLSSGKLLRKMFQSVEIPNLPLLHFFSFFQRMELLL